MFVEYINQFLKFKQEASGWPVTSTTKNTKNKYLEKYNNVENIKLDETKIFINPRSCLLAKLSLTSFLVKFGQRDNLPEAVVLITSKKLLAI